MTREQGIAIGFVFWLFIGIVIGWCLSPDYTCYYIKQNREWRVTNEGTKVFVKGYEEVWKHTGFGKDKLIRSQRLDG